MADPSTLYLKQLHDGLRYWGTWLPGRRIQVGDSGPLNGVVFDPQGRLQHDYGIAVRLAPSPQRWPALEHQTKRGIGVELLPTSATTPAGRAELAVTFKRANSVLFVAEHVREQSMADRGTVSAKLAELRRAGTFPADQVVVSDVLVATSLTVLMSQSRGETVTVQVAAPIGTAIGPAALAAGLGITGNGATNIKIVGKRNVSPLFRLMKPPTGFWASLGDTMGSIFGKGQPTTVACLQLTHDLPDRAPGQRLRVQPQGGQSVLIRSVGGAPVTVDTNHWGSLDIEPVDLSAGGLLASGGDEIPIGTFHSAEGRADSIEFTSPSPLPLGRFELHLNDDVPVMVQPLHGDPLWARPMSPVMVDVAGAGIDPPSMPTTMPVEYVDFDEAYAGLKTRRAT